MRSDFTRQRAVIRKIEKDRLELREMLKELVREHSGSPKRVPVLVWKGIRELLTRTEDTATYQYLRYQKVYIEKDWETVDVLFLIPDAPTNSIFQYGRVMLEDEKKMLYVRRRKGTPYWFVIRENYIGE